MNDGEQQEKPRFHALWMFLKAQLSAQLASLIDFLVTILLAKIWGIFYLYATFAGSVVGGIVNCVVNYGWVFHANGVKKTHVAIKYLLVWIGSILLNTWGTYFFTEWLTSIRWLANLSAHYVDNMFIISKIIVALLVAFFWNYQMQHSFVYSNRNIKGFLKRLFNE